jgi:hypothetical protein
VHVPTGAACAISLGLLALATGAGGRRLALAWAAGLLVGAPWIANFAERFLARDALGPAFFDRFPEAWALELGPATLRALRFDALATALPAPLWALGLVGLAVSIWRWRAGRASLAERYALLATLGAAALLLTPLYGLWLEIARSSPARPALALLLPLLVGIGVGGALDGARAMRVAPAIARAAVALAFVLIALATVRSVERFAATAERRVAPASLSGGPLGDWELGERLGRTGPRPRVVLSDPGTSYAWPYYAGSFVVAIPSERGSPFVDDRARFEDVRRFFDPRAPLAELEAILERYRVDAVAIDASGRRSPADGALLERLRALPTFEDTGCCGALVVLRVRR